MRPDDVTTDQSRSTSVRQAAIASKSFLLRVLCGFSKIWHSSLTAYWFMAVIDGIDCRVFCESAQGGREYNEDVLSVRVQYGSNSAQPRFAFFAVFDGHGGAEAARFADRHLLDQIRQRPQFSSTDDSDVVQAIKDGFVATHHMMTTAVGTLLDEFKIAMNGPHLNGLRAALNSAS